MYREWKDKDDFFQSKNLTFEQTRKIAPLLDELRKLNKEQLELIESNICQPLRESMQAIQDARFGKECINKAMRKNERVQEVMRTIFKETGSK